MLAIPLFHPSSSEWYLIYDVGNTDDQGRRLGGGLSALLDRFSKYDFNTERGQEIGTQDIVDRLSPFVGTGGNEGGVPLFTPTNHTSQFLLVI
jgi:hypothetical protein